MAQESKDLYGDDSEPFRPRTAAEIENDRKQSKGINPQEAAAVVLDAAKGAKAVTSGAETKVERVVEKAASAAVAATAAPEVEARADFEVAAPKFPDPAPAPKPAPVARPVIPAPATVVPAASAPQPAAAAAAPAPGPTPPSRAEYEAMVARRGSPVRRTPPHPSTLPPALRPTKQGA